MHLFGAMARLRQAGEGRVQGHRTVGQLPPDGKAAGVKDLGAVARERLDVEFLLAARQHEAREDHLLGRDDRQRAVTTADVRHRPSMTARNRFS